MSKKNSRIPKDGPVWHRSSEEATLDQMPRFNAHVCKTGAHGDVKYNRAKQKRNWQQEMKAGGAIGPLRFGPHRTRAAYAAMMQIRPM